MESPGFAKAPKKSNLSLTCKNIVKLYPLDSVIGHICVATQAKQSC